jgi:ribosome maturation factor RimP
MINAELIKGYLRDEVAEMGLFLVDVMVNPGNRIFVYIDSMNGVTLKECIAVNRYLESKLDRDSEDFELEVSSPGLDRPLKLPIQFEKNKGRMLEVVKHDGIKITGRLLKAGNESIQLDTEVVVKDAKTGKKRTESKMLEIKFEEIKTAKILISLKK